MATNSSAGFPIVTCLVPSLRHSVRQVACGVSHCVALVQGETGDLQLHSWGLGQYGQLGLGHGIQVATTMTPITTSVELVGALAANSNRSAAIRLSCGPISSCLTLPNAVSTSVWLWGLLPSPLDAHSFVHQHVPSGDFITECQFRVEQVSVGLAHVVLLSDSGRVFTWGHNTSGQLGLGLQHTQTAVGNAPYVVTFHQKDLVIGSIACGYDHTLALSRDKTQLFAWGSNRLGACGATTKFFEYSHPVLLGLARSTEKIQSISCKAHTSVAVISGSSTRRVMAWGVCGPETARLLPSIADEIDHEDDTYISIAAGLGFVQSLVEHGDDRLPRTSRLDPLIAEAGPQAVVESANSARLSAPQIIGISVISASANLKPRLCDLHWTRPVLHHARVVSGDVVVVLLQSELSLTGLTLTLQSSGESSSAVEPTVLHTTPASSLYLAAVPVDSVQRCSLEWHYQQESEPLTLLSVDCCLHPKARDEVLRKHRDFVLTCFDSALDTIEAAQFSAFIEAICRNHEIDDAIAHSHLAVALEQDQLQSASLDVDRLAMEKAHRLSCLGERDSQFPSSFGLWESHLECREDANAFELANLEGLSLWDLLVSMHEDASDDATHLEMLYLSIANQLIEWQPRQSPQDESDRSIEPLNSVSFNTEASAVSLSSPVKLSVPQNAMDFLVCGSKSLAALHGNNLQQQANRNHQSSRIRVWWNDRGDLFYSHCGDSSGESEEGVVQIHLPNDFHDSSRSTAPRNFQYQLHRFMWDVLDARSFSIRELYGQLGSISDGKILQTRLERLGFNGAAPREVWFSMFTVMQRHTTGAADTKTDRLTLHALRLFLVDPFHGEFFQNYLADWRDAVRKHRQVKGTQFRVRDLLASAFQDNEVCDLQRVPWDTVVAGLYRLHDELQRELQASDVCRLLYHFDVHGDGFFNLGGFLKCLLGQNSPISKPQRKSATAIDPSRRRPDVDAFTTPDAVRKLFQSRTREDANSPSTETTGQVSRLLHIGNTRLAQIRNLPVSRLLSEGVHFRPRNLKNKVKDFDHSDEDRTRDTSLTVGFRLALALTV